MELPPRPHLELVVHKYAEVLAALQLTRGEQPLVLPTGDWFPDTFTGDQASFERLLARMQGYAALEAVDIEAELVGAAVGGSCDTGGCGSGGCGSSKPATEAPELRSSGGRYTIRMPSAALAHPIAMTASLARMLGQIRLAQAGRSDVEAPVAELAAVALGFGVLLLEASHLYQKSCGGPSVGQATACNLGELALPFALFVATEGHKMRAALGELAVTQRAVLDEAWALASSNPKLVERLRSAPRHVKLGTFSLDEARSWLSRLFSKKARPTDLHQAALEALERGDDLDDVAELLGTKSDRAREPGKPRAHDDIGNLVDEALAELHATRADDDARQAAE